MYIEILDNQKICKKLIGTWRNQHSRDRTRLLSFARDPRPSQLYKGKSSCNSFAGKIFNIILVYFFIGREGQEGERKGLWRQRRMHRNEVSISMEILCDKSLIHYCFRQTKGIFSNKKVLEAY